MKIRRKLRIAALALLCLGAAVYFGGLRWRQARLHRRVARALGALEGGSDAWIDRQLIAEITGNPRYEPELRLFHAAWLLNIGEPAGVFPAIAGLRPEGEIRASLLLVLGEAYYKTGQLPESERVFRQLTLADPQNSRAHRWLATIYHDLGNIVAAFGELEKVAELEPDDFFAYRLMGMINLLDYQKHKEAAACYRKALERSPPEEQTQAMRLELAQAMAAMNDFAGATDVLDAAQVNARVLAQKAECRWGVGEREQAIELLSQALALDPLERRALLLKARFALEDGKPDAAVAPLKSVLEDDPHDFNTRYQLSIAYRRLGDKQASVFELEQSNASKELRSRLNHLYAEAMQRAGDVGVRIEIAEVCDMLRKPDLAQKWRRSAEYCRQQGGGINLPN